MDCLKDKMNENVGNIEMFHEELKWKRNEFVRLKNGEKGNKKVL